MEALNAYIPMDRRQAMSRGTELPDRTTGAALFADISGFTPLTGALAAELGRKRGAEEVMRHLNPVYEAIIAELHRYGGSVIGFAGDAITCWFDETPRRPLSGAVLVASRRGVACALAMQQAMTHFAVVKTPAGMPVSLGIKVAVAAGPARRFLVGDPKNKAFDALAGATLERMADAEHEAEKGEVVISQEVVEALGDEVRVAEWRIGEKKKRRFAVVSGLTAPVTDAPWPIIPAGTLTEQMIRSSLVPLIYERLRMGRDFLGDLRPVVPLFLKFGGLDFDKQDDAGERLDAYIRWVQSVVTRLEGTLLELMIGDKGCYLYAVFGAPIAHQDDVVRAVAAALALQAPPAELSWIGQVQIGISRGEARTGHCGAKMRRTYSVIGNQVNMAARLMGKSKPGQILVHYRVQEAAADHFDFNSLGEIMVKGRATPLPISEVIGRRVLVQPALLTTPMIGRQKEVARLGAALDAVQAGGSQVQIQIIYGEAGIGKSRLVAELSRLVQERGFTTLLGAGQSIEQYTPYRAFRDILATYFELEQITDQAERQEHVKRLVNEHTPEQIERLPLLNDILNLALPETELTASLEPALRQESLLVLLLTLLRHSAQKQPLIMMLEDAHWLDSLSWQLVVQVARGLISSADPLLLVLVTRPLDQHSSAATHLASLQAMDVTETITLEHLSPALTVDLVKSCLGVHDLPQAASELIVSRANGNPFFAQELVFTLRDEGVLRIEPPRCVISGDLNKQNLPDTIQGLVLARIDRLPSNKQLLLKVAAVIGRTFTYTPLEYTLKQHVTAIAQQLQKQLDELSQRDFMALDSPEPDLTYIFKHIITQEVAYDTLLFAQRKQLHRTVASWYERNYGAGTIAGDVSFIYPLLVYHYHHAEEREQERYYAKLAGERAAAQYANQAAIRYFSRALQLTEESDYLARYDLLLAREKVYDWQGKREEQAQDLASLSDIVAILNDNLKKATVSLRQANYERWLNHYPAALSAVQEAIEQAIQASESTLEVEGHFLWGRILRIQRDYEAAEQQLQHALTRAKDTEHQKVEADSLLDLGSIHFYRGNYTTAPEYYHRAQSIYQALNERKDEAGCFVMLAVINMQVGNYSNANKYYKQALDICQIIGYRQGQAVILGNLGVNYGDSGDYEAAHDYQEQALKIALEVGDRMRESIAFSNLTLIHYNLGQYEFAKESSEQALTLHRALGDQRSEGYTLTYLGHLLTALNQLETAIEAYQKAMQMRRELGEEHLVMDNLAGLARLALRQGEAEQALAYVEEILTWITANGVEGIEFPLQVYLTCYQVLQTTSEGDADAFARADRILLTAHTMLQEQAAKIKDEAWRRKFLENVPFNREIMAAWESRARTEVGEYSLRS